MTIYAITDGEQRGWLAEARNLEESASLIQNAKEFVIAIESGKVRALTPEEDAELERYRKWYL